MISFLRGEPLANIMFFLFSVSKIGCNILVKLPEVNNTLLLLVLLYNFINIVKWYGGIGGTVARLVPRATIGATCPKFEPATATFPRGMCFHAACAFTRHDSREHEELLSRAMISESMKSCFHVP